jgi:16S rRNA (guanine527-N7)-methyltransferase
MAWNTSTARDLSKSGASGKAQDVKSEQGDLPVARWRELNITSDSAIIEKLDIYFQELHKFNKRLNLVSSGTVGKADAVHIGDAVRAWGILSSHFPGDALIHDFGSGNGVPGLIFAALEAVANGKRKFRLIDRDQRKLEFLKHVAFKMGLSNVSVANEDVSRLPDESVRYAVSRGFAPVTAALLTAMRPISVGGSFFMLKSDGWAKEVADIPTPVFGSWQVEMVGQYKVPETAADYVLIRALKTGNSQK